MNHLDTGISRRNAADDLARLEAIDADAIRAERRERFQDAPSVDPRIAERTRRYEAYGIKRLRNEDLGQLVNCLMDLRRAAMEADADGITPVVQSWIDEWMPQKTAAKLAMDEAGEAVIALNGSRGGVANG